MIFADTMVVCDHFLPSNHRLRVGSGSKVSAFCRDVLCIESAFVSTFCNSSHLGAAVICTFHTS